MVRNAVDHRLDSARLGRLCREASAGLARLRSAVQALAGRMASVCLDESGHEVGVARVSSMVLVEVPEHFYRPDPDPKDGPECRDVPWALNVPTAGPTAEQVHQLRVEFVQTAARLDELAAAYRRDHDPVADRWAALAATVRKARLSVDRSLAKPARVGGSSPKFINNPRPKTRTA